MTLWVANRGEVDRVVGKKLPVSGGIFVQVHAQHHQLRHFPLQLVERGNLLNARGAPAGPKIENYNLTAVGAQLQTPATVRNGEIRRTVPDLLWTVTPVTTGGKQEQENNHG